MMLLLCSHSPNDVPPVPQLNVSIAAVRGAVRPSKTVNDQRNRIYITNLIGQNEKKNAYTGTLKVF